MGHNALIHGGVGSGQWANGYVFTPNDFQQIDQYIFQSINGDLGGTWAPSTPIIIGGSGVQLTTGLTVTAGTTSIQGDFNVFGTSTILGGLDFHGPVTLTAAGSMVLSGPLTVLAASGNSFQGDTTFTGSKTYVVASGSTWNFANVPSFLGGLSVSGAGTVQISRPTTFFTGAPVTLQDALTVITGGSILCSGTGHIGHRPFYSMTNADQTIGIASGSVATQGADCVVVNTGALSAARQITVLNANATTGKRMRFKTYDSTNAITVINENATVIGTLKSGTVAANGVTAPPPAGFWNWMEIEFGGTNNWVIIGGQSA